LQQRTPDAAKDALGITNEALSISCYSEKLLEMKGEALCKVCGSAIMNFEYLFLFKLGSL